jgi:hypothetical protein
MFPANPAEVPMIAAFFLGASPAQGQAARLANRASVAGRAPSPWNRAFLLFLQVFFQEGPRRHRKNCEEATSSYGKMLAICTDFGI